MRFGICAPYREVATLETCPFDRISCSGPLSSHTCMSLKSKNVRLLVAMGKIFVPTSLIISQRLSDDDAKFPSKSCR